VPGTLRSTEGCEDAAMAGVVEEAVEQRLEGGRPGRLRALLAAVVVGVSVAVLVYRLLRSRQGSGE
jgi:hypothetical protein